MQTIIFLFQIRKITNSGFLYGPFIPIFGFTALIIYFFDLYFSGFPIQIKLAVFFILPTGMEYFTGYLLEKIFKVKLWDYSRHPFNLKGRISLGVSIIWFGLILFQVYLLQNIIFNGMNWFNEQSRIILAAVLLIYFLVDFFFSAKMFYYFSKLKKDFGKKDLKNLNQKFKKRIKSISNKIKISSVFERNISKDIKEFINVSKK